MFRFQTYVNEVNPNRSTNIGRFGNAVRGVSLVEGNVTVDSAQIATSLVRAGDDIFVRQEATNRKVCYTPISMTHMGQSTWSDRTEITAKYLDKPARYPEVPLFLLDTDILPNWKPSPFRTGLKTGATNATGFGALGAAIGLATFGPFGIGVGIVYGIMAGSATAIPQAINTSISNNFRSFAEALNCALFFIRQMGTTEDSKTLFWCAWRRATLAEDKTIMLQTWHMLCSILPIEEQNKLLENASRADREFFENNRRPQSAQVANCWPAQN